VTHRISTGPKELALASKYEAGLIVEHGASVSEMKATIQMDKEVLHS
jgi:hypothetical protein